MAAIFGFALEIGFELESGFGAARAALEEAFERHGLLPDGFEDAVHGADEFVPAAGLAGELLAAGGGEAVEARFAVVFGGAPLGADPAAVLEAVEGGVE